MREKGFTLIEIIVVIIIIAVMTSVVTLSVGGPSYSKFLGGAEKISNTFSILADEAVFTSSVVSCDVTPTSLKCRKYRDGEWNDLPLTRLVAWGWPKDLRIAQVVLNGVPIKDKQPILFLPSGDNGDISIQVVDQQYSAWIDGDMSGRYKVSN
jgi:type II secretion system protein H